MITHQLIIDGQPADLGNVSITLEYVSNLFGDLGKINLSRSYTVSLPKTRRNSAILDHPGAPAHTSSMARRYFSARYVRNGIDLLGEARAYLLRSTGDAYDVALVWSTLEGLQELSQSKATLNDLPGLPVLRWIGPNGRTPDYRGLDDDSGAFHAWYNCGLGLSSGPEGTLDPAEINAATHPCMRVRTLFERILITAGVPFALHSEKAEAAMNSQGVLAAPSAKPSRSMEDESGTSYSSALTRSNDTRLSLSGASNGWDPVQASPSVTIKTEEEGETEKHRVFVDLAAPSSFAPYDLTVQGYSEETGDTVELARAKYTDGAYFLDTVIGVRGMTSYGLVFDGPAGSLPNSTFNASDQAHPLVRFNRVRDGIQIAKDNRFPIEGNLPDIGQWEFVKSCAALYGLVPVISGGALHFYDYDNLLDIANAYDWSAKVDETRDGSPLELAYTENGWAQDNAIVWTEDERDPLPFDPTVSVEVEDTTLKGSRDWFKLPFAASLGSSAQHYQLQEDGTVESLDMKPRIFSTAAFQSITQLVFADHMHGEGMKAAYYARVQEVMRRPVSLSVNIRLNEIDVATLDMARPVYLRQFGRYYAIRKIQTSDSDLCKVELLQLP